MIKVILLLAAVQVALVLTMPADTVVEPVTEASNSTATAAPTEFASQCKYNFKGERLNKGCNAAKPIKCEGSGILVQTTVGEDYEMCCCNI